MSITTTPSKLFPHPPRHINSICVPVLPVGKTNFVPIDAVSTCHIPPSKSSYNQPSKINHLIASTAGRGFNTSSSNARSARNRVNIPAKHHHHQDRKSNSVRTIFTQTVHIKKVSKSSQTDVTHEILKPIHLDKDIAVIKRVNQGTQTPSSLSRPSIYRRRISLPNRQTINVNIRVSPKL